MAEAAQVGGRRVGLRGGVPAPAHALISTGQIPLFGRLDGQTRGPIAMPLPPAHTKPRTLDASRRPAGPGSALLGPTSDTLLLLLLLATARPLSPQTGATPLDMAKAHRRVSTAELLAGRAVQLNELRTDAANQARRREWQTLVAAKAKAARETAAVGPALWETSAPPPRMKPLPFFEADARGGHATGSPGGGASSRDDGGGGWWEAGSAAGLSGRGSVASGWSIASSRAAVAEAGSEAGAAGHRGRGPEADEVDARSVGRVARDADRAARLLLPQDEGPAGAYSRGTSARGTAGTHRG